MFATVFVVCNLSVGYCQALAPSVLQEDKQACLTIAEEARQKGLENTGGQPLVIMYQCVEFPEPT